MKSDSRFAARMPWHLTLVDRSIVWWAAMVADLVARRTVRARRRLFRHADRPGWLLAPNLRSARNSSAVTSEHWWSAAR
jgi:hypothetical protein